MGGREWRIFVRSHGFSGKEGGVSVVANRVKRGEMET